MDSSEFEKLVQETIREMGPLPEISELRNLYSELQEMVKTKSLREFKKCAEEKLNQYEDSEHFGTIETTKKMLRRCCFTKKDAEWILRIDMETLDDLEVYKKRSIAIGEVTRRLIADLNK